MFVELDDRQLEASRALDRRIVHTLHFECPCLMVVGDPDLVGQQLMLWKTLPWIIELRKGHVVIRDHPLFEDD